MADATPLWETTVYGPVRSRRLGTSLGVNLTPWGSKLCSFNCPYCQCGFNTAKADGARWPSPDEVAH
ncbi:MAG: radical SAM protein, partial [Gemmatimonadales bacterium]